MDEERTLPAQPRTSGRLVVVGGGMVAHRLVEALTTATPTGRAWQIDVFAEEPRPPYDRVALTSFFSGRDPEDLLLGEPELWAGRVCGCTPTRRSPRSTPSDARSTPVAGCFSYDAWCSRPGRTPASRRSRAATCPAPSSTAPSTTSPSCGDGSTTRDARAPVRGAVVGGGLLGLEAAGALTALGVETTVVEFAPRLMPLQVDEGGGEVLRRLIEELGVDVRTSTATSGSAPAATAGCAGWTSPTARSSSRRPGRVRPGVRPRDELAREAGLPVGERGGIVVDEACRTARPGRVRDRRGRLHRRPHLGPGRARVHDGRGRGRPAARRRRRRSPGPTPPPSSSCSASTSPASATRSRRRRAPSRWSTPTPSPASTRSSSSPTTHRPCWAASSWATRVPTPRCAPWSAGARRRPRLPGCSPTARHRRRRRPARRREGLQLQQRDRRQHPLRRHRGRLHRPGAVSRPAPGPAPAAAPACRWSRSW